jgi:hypothetical protein
MSVEKAAIITSHPRATRMLRARLGVYAGTPKDHVVTLGVDYAAGRGRGTYIHPGRQAARLKVAREKLRRLDRLRRRARAGQTQRLYVAGILLVITYGAQVCGIDNGVTTPGS